MCIERCTLEFFEVDLVYFKHLSNYLLLTKPKTVSNSDYARHLGVILFFSRAYRNSIVVTYVIAFTSLVVLF